MMSQMDAAHPRPQPANREARGIAPEAAPSRHDQPAPLDAPAGALIAALRAAPEAGEPWIREGDARWIARSAPMAVLLRAGDLLRIPDLDWYSQIALADEVTRVARDPAAAAGSTASPASAPVLPDPGEMASAYRAVHGHDAPWLTRQAWNAGQLSTAAGTVRTAPWYLAATAAKRDGRPMSAVPLYMAAARMEATAGRLRDHRDPLGTSDDVPGVADALAQAAAAMRAGDPGEARSAISRARDAITPGSPLHHVLGELETPAAHFAGTVPPGGPAARPTRAARRPSHPVQPPASGRSR